MTDAAAPAPPAFPPLVRPAGDVDPGGDWDGFVTTAALGSYLQRSAWARVKAVNGWGSARVIAAGAEAIGAQVLLRRPRPLPWSFAYAPRGPVARAWTPDAVAAFTDALRHAPLGRVSHVRIDPEVERDGPDDPDGRLRRALAGVGWRPAPPIQPATTRCIDLTAGEEVLWGDLRKKWRQYVNKARANGVTVIAVEEAPGAPAGPRDGLVTAGGALAGPDDRAGQAVARSAGVAAFAAFVAADPIAPFYAVYRETATRAGFLIRVEQAYRDVWDAFRPTGDAAMLFAVDAEGAPQAALFLVRNGLRVVEPYGGMTQAGAELRANYLLKWEAIRRSRAAGAATYDLWGLAHPGIAHFKAGFGGREVAYVGAWDLVLDRFGRAVFGGAQRLRVRAARARAGLRGPAAGGGGATGDVAGTAGAGDAGLGDAG